MAFINPVADATIKSHVAEQHLFHAIMLLQQIESDPTYNSGTNKKDYTQTSFNDNLSVFNATFNIPCESTIGSDGKPSFAGSNYLTSYTAFTPGTDGTFKSTHLPAYVVEAIYYCQILENSTTNNPNNKSYINGSYDSDKRVFAGTITFPYTKTLEATGDLKISIPEYLAS